MLKNCVLNGKVHEFDSHWRHIFLRVHIAVDSFYSHLEQHMLLQPTKLPIQIHHSLRLEHELFQVQTEF